MWWQVANVLPIDSLSEIEIGRNSKWIRMKNGLTVVFAFLKDGNLNLGLEQNGHMYFCVIFNERAFISCMVLHNFLYLNWVPFSTIHIWNMPVDGSRGPHLAQLQLSSPIWAFMAYSWHWSWLGCCCLWLRRASFLVAPIYGSCCPRLPSNRAALLCGRSVFVPIFQLHLCDWYAYVGVTPPAQQGTRQSSLIRIQCTIFTICNHLSDLWACPGNRRDWENVFH